MIDKSNSLHVLLVIYLFGISLVLRRFVLISHWTNGKVGMPFWIHLSVVDHKVNKESTLYWLMCHEHFESIWLTKDTVFRDFNPTLFSKIFLVYCIYCIYFLKIQNLTLPIFKIFHVKTFFRWVIIFWNIMLWSWKCYEKIRLYL